MSDIQAIRGTKDIYSSEIDLWRIIEKISCEIIELANYKEIRTPIFEKSLLYNRSLGEITDIVQKEMYTFLDKGKREITLRPEGTASIVRAFIEHKFYNQTLPQRFWYYGPMFRYERPQAGRQRQFHQLGVECLGSNDPLADVEIINLALEIFSKLKISNLKLEINSLGSNSARIKYTEELYNYFSCYKSELDSDSIARLEKNPLRILDTKNEHTRQIIQGAPKILNFLDLDSKKHFDKVCEYLNVLNISYTINPNLVRGLDYYNDTTFEIKSSALGSQDTICGGGRYDNLIKTLGGPSTPAVGWAIGMERLVLTSMKFISSNTNLECYFITLGESAKLYSLPIIQILRKHNLQIEMSVSEATLQKQIKKALQLQAIICIIVGEEEINKQQLQVKWLHSKEQEYIHLDSIAQLIYKIKIEKQRVLQNSELNII